MRGKAALQLRRSRRDERSERNRRSRGSVDDVMVAEQD